MKDVTIPILLQNELVSTQTDLNPNDSSFEQYKKSSCCFLFILFRIIYLEKKKNIFNNFNYIFNNFNHLFITK